MTSIKVIFRASAAKDKEGTLYFRIIHRRKVRQIHTGNRITINEWNEAESKIEPSQTASRQKYLDAVQKKLNNNIRRLERIVATLRDTGKEYTAGDIVELYHRSDSVTGFISFSRKIIEENRQMGKASAVEHYTSALNSLIRFYGDDEIPFNGIDSGLISRYECHLKGLNLTPNTTSYYMRKLRAIYNIAVDRELTIQRHPFRHVYTGVAKTKKRAVSLDIIKTLRDMDLTADPLTELARDMFLFSFYTRGMAMVDMSYLKKSNLQNGMLTYRRQKTGQLLHIRWEKPMQDIVRRHGIDNSEFLLPLIKKDGSGLRRQYQNASHLINRHLKKLGLRLGMTEPLTMYCARHAWASIAHANNVPVSVISQGMGHDSEKTTRIYLASLHTSVVDKANYAIIGLLDS